MLSTVEFKNERLIKPTMIYIGGYEPTTTLNFDYTYTHSCKKEKRDMLASFMTLESFHPKKQTSINWIMSIQSC